MNVKERFIRNLIDELKEVNKRQNDKLDICFMVSVVDQHIEECKEFIEDISINTYRIGSYEEDDTEGYTSGKIKIYMDKYNYSIDFRFDERMWGYCECSPKKTGYNTEHGCCGNGCDWYAPSFSITKEIHIGHNSWTGYESDYWEYERNFKIKEYANNIEFEKLEKEKIKSMLEKQIAELQERITKI